MDEYVELATAIIMQAVEDYRKAKKKIDTKTEYRELVTYEKWAGKHIAEMLEREAEYGIIPARRVELFKERRGLWGGWHPLMRNVASPFIRDPKLRALRTMQEVSEFMKRPPFEAPADTETILRQLEREAFGRRKK